MSSNITLIDSRVTGYQTLIDKLPMGSTVLDSGSLESHAVQLASIGSAMTQTGEIF